MTTEQKQALPLHRAALQLLPGLALTAGVAGVGLISSEWIGTELLGFDKSPVSGIMMAIIFGLLIGNLFTLPVWLQPGITFSLKKVLRLGIILLGIRLSLGDVLELGAIGIPLVIVCIVGTLWLVQWLGKRLGLPHRINTLIAVGTSICGATAIVATGPAIDAEEEELTYAVANITVFGILAMFLYPYLAHGLFLADLRSAGLFLGTAIHETAQVAGSGLIYDQLYDAEETLDVATVTKLVRNVLMAIVIPLMATRHRRQTVTNDTETPGSKKRITFLSLFPVFILGFLLLAVVRTVGDETLKQGAAWGLFGESGWDSLTTATKEWAERFLAVAMAGVGLGTSFKQLRGLGLKPFYVGLAASLSVGVLSVAGIALLNVLGLN
ncbi:MAG: putative sulfate exporter family transporter [Chloroflexi bacterium]|nr:putative sulfate exporter family transporter [Chloroflexota bacterium]